MAESQIKMLARGGVTVALLFMGSNSLFAAMECVDCIGGVAPRHTLYCNRAEIALCTDGCHGDDQSIAIQPSVLPVEKGIKSSNQFSQRATWMQKPWSVTFSSIDDKYRLVFAKAEAPLSSIGAVFRRRSNDKEERLKIIEALRIRTKN